MPATQAHYLLRHSSSLEGRFLKRDIPPNSLGGLNAQPGSPLPSLTLMMTASFPTPLRMLYQMPREEADGSACGQVYGLGCPGSAWVGPTLQALRQIEGHPQQCWGRHRSPGIARALGCTVLLSPYGLSMSNLMDKCLTGCLLGNLVPTDPVPSL